MARTKNTAAVDITRLSFGSAGRTGLDRFGGYINEEWHTDLRGYRAAKVFQEIHDNEPVIGGIYRWIETLTKQSLLKVDAASDDPRATFWADFVEGCFYDMETNFSDFNSEILTMIPHGWAMFEMLFKIRRGDKFNDPCLNSRYDDGLIGFRDIETRGQTSLSHWEYSDSGRLLGMWQTDPVTGKNLFVPIEKCLHFRTAAPKGNPEGRSWYRNCYTTYYFLKNHRVTEAIGIERNLAGLPHMEVPVELFDSANATALTEFKNFVAKVRNDEFAGIVSPASKNRDGTDSGFKFGLVSSSGRQPADIDTVIKRLESRMAIPMIGEFILLGQDKTGSYALSSDKTNIFAMAIGSLLDNRDDVLNKKAVPALMVLNNVPREYWPEVSHTDIEKEDLQAFAAGISALVASGWITPTADDEDLTRERFGLSTVTHDQATEIQGGIDNGDDQDLG